MIEFFFCLNFFSNLRLTLKNTYVIMIKLKMTDISHKYGQNPTKKTTYHNL